ncbi:large subunit terminase [Caudoviricetes sp.]|nr:large subunit terminase [Caudoviricetes sp.]
MPPTKIVWEAQPGSQSAALDARADVILYTGTRGPGKTDAQIMRFRSRVGLGYGAAWRGIILDFEYKNLDDIVAKTKKWFPLFEDGAKFHASQGSYKWVWPTGEELLIRAAKKAEDYWSFHGHEYPFIGWNELTKYAKPDLFDAMFSTNRSGFIPPKGSKLPPIPLEVFITSNPYGPGHGWVKRRFIDPAPYGQIVRTKVTVPKPGGKPGELVDVTRRQVALFGSWVENKFLDPMYVATLMGEKNKARKRAWLTGDWNIVAGGAFDDLWDERIHVVPRFVIPKGWRIDRAFDWGSSHPFYVGWFAESNGEEATIIEDGREFSFCPPRGTIVLCHEWYGVDPDAPNTGIQLSSADIARGILEREAYLRESGWFSSAVMPGPADNQISAIREKDVKSIADKMSEIGVSWTTSDKSAGSRVNGLQLLRDRLEASLRFQRRIEADKGLFFMSHCRHAISTIPMLPRDPDKLEDVDTDAEDHPYDAVRYRVLAAAKRLDTKIDIRFG